jgi:Beta-propeller repeat
MAAPVPIADQRFITTLPTTDPAPTPTTRLNDTYAHLPLSFEANHGQADALVDFIAHGNGYTVLLTRGEAMLAMPRSSPAAASGAELAAEETSTVVHMQLRGAAAQPEAAGREQLPGTANYFRGNDPSRWHTGIPTYAHVEYLAVYPGIDLVYHANQGQLEHDFVVSPGADPKAIHLGFGGAEKVELNDTGELVVHVAGGQLRQAPPVIYQDGPRGPQPVAGGYVLNELGEIDFAVSTYDETRPLVIDPVLVYSTFLGASGGDIGVQIAVGAGGDAYVTGYTGSPDFPVTPGAVQTLRRGGDFDAFVAKLNPTGTALVYSTFLGSANDDRGVDIAVDAAGNAYVTGSPGFSDFPTTPGALQRELIANADGFVAKLDPTGTTLVYSTFLGGFFAQPSAIAVDGAGSAYVTGNTRSDFFPTTPGAFQLDLKGGQDAFVVKLNAKGTARVYSTLLGGTFDAEFGSDVASDIAVDGAGNAYVTGYTPSPDFPTTPGAFRRTGGGLSLDGFVAKLNATGTALVYSTFLGGMGSDLATSIALDPDQDAYLAGWTTSPDFPTTPGALQPTHAPVGIDVFVTKLNPAGTGPVYSTVLGATNVRTTSSVALDAAGNAYVTGTAFANDFPTTPDALQRTGVGTEPFVVKLNATGTALVYSTFLGGSRQDTASGLAVDRTGNAYLIGSTSSADFPTTPGAFQRTFVGGDDPQCLPDRFGCGPNVHAFIAKLGLGDTTPPACTITAVIAGPPKQLQITIQDTSGGLNSIIVITSVNANTVVPRFAAGSGSPVVVTATKLDQAKTASVIVRVTDMGGNVTTCDPAMVTVTRGHGKPVSKVVTGVAEAESQVSIYNYTPGLKRIDVTVNGVLSKVRRLRDGEVRTIDVAAALQRGNDNTVVLTPRSTEGSAEVLISNMAHHTASQNGTQHHTADLHGEHEDFEFLD